MNRNEILHSFSNRKRKNANQNSFLDYYYPILGRLPELEHFDDILDEIGVVNRKYSGVLIEV